MPTAANTHANAIDLGMRLVEGLRKWSADLRRSEPEPSMGAEQSPYNINLGKVHSGDWTSTAPSQRNLQRARRIPAIVDTDQGGRRGAQGDRRVRGGRLRLSDPADRHAHRFSRQGYLLDEESRARPRPRRRASRRAWHHPGRHTRVGSTTDARTYLNDFDIPAVCFGAVAHNMHGIDESVELQSIVDAARTLARFLLMRFGSDEVSA